MMNYCEQTYMGQISGKTRVWGGFVNGELEVGCGAVC